MGICLRNAVWVLKRGAMSLNTLIYEENENWRRTTARTFMASLTQVSRLVHIVFSHMNFICDARRENGKITCLFLTVDLSFIWEYHKQHIAEIGEGYQWHTNITTVSGREYPKTVCTDSDVIDGTTVSVTMI